MGKVLVFKRPTAKDKNQGQTLCRHGYHKWKVVTSKKFDVKAGKLVTVLRCERCGTEKTRLL